MLNVAETKPQGSSDSNLYKEKVILCIDDDEINQMILQGMLRSQLYRCGCGRYICEHHTVIFNED